MGNIHRVAKENGGEYYVEACDPQGSEKPDCDCVYVCTRTPWRTSVFGQVESCGWIERSKLEPLNLKRKGDRQIVENVTCSLPLKVRGFWLHRGYYFYRSPPASIRARPALLLNVHIL